MPSTAIDEDDPPRRRWPGRVGAAVLLVVLLAAVVASVPALRIRAVAAATGLDALGVGFPRLFAPSVAADRRTIAGVDGAWFDPGPDAPVILLVPGAAPEGLDDPRIVRVAEALARSDRAVFMPELRVYQQTLVVEDVDDLVEITLQLAAERGPVLLVGASFGGSLGLLAAADERIDDQLTAVATFGSYMDLLGVIQAGTTGTALVGDLELPWEPHPLADEVIRDQLVDLLPEQYREELVEVLDGDRDPAELPEEIRAAYELAMNDDPERTRELAEHIPQHLQRRLAEVSPITVADRIDTRVIAMHSTQDPAIPFAELVRLGHAVPHAELHALDTFSHVDLDLDTPRDWWNAAGDLRVVWRFVAGILDAQSGQPPATR
ncbi:alpha/beta fold hydrolase [Egicoccus sp. AB-alg6-2]|uniref:alpha/beta fold hydrolase n=1 Tax=Egicoccus sp. AB-alg6-2 TaxID=3242692 RepID=UPI00359F0B96